MMKRFVIMFAALGLLFACTPENNSNNGGGKNNSEELTTTGEALEVTVNSAKLTGYANLPFELGDAEVGIMYDKIQSFESSKKAVATGLDGNNKFTVIVIGLEPSTTYYYKSYVQNGMAVKYGSVLSFTTKESIVPAGAVDLCIIMTREDGTTYNLYWAVSNLCEDGLCPNPEDYGDYYAWGEIKTKPAFSWSTYKWIYNNLTKYNTSSSYGTVDNKTQLDPEDDVVHVTLGGNWRMPTDAEWTELRTQCTCTRTTQNGVNGRKVTGPNGNSIFLPAAGYRDGSGLEAAGSGGGYWSSSLDADYPYFAWFVAFRPDDVGRNAYDRYYGRSVRPVSE